MTHDLGPTIALGVGGALLAFECFAALASLVAAGATKHARQARLSTNPSMEPSLSLTPRIAIRAHFVAQRDLVNATRRQYPTLRSPRHGHDLRVAIRDLPRHPLGGNPRSAARAVAAQA